jgi:hypothetical protein
LRNHERKSYHEIERFTADQQRRYRFKRFEQEESVKKMLWNLGLALANQIKQPMRDPTVCPKRPVLERAVIKARQAVHAAKPEDRGPLRRNGRAAVKALHQHVEERGCKGVKTAAR